MNIYNNYYFFNNINEKLSNNLEDINSIMDKIYNFIKYDRYCEKLTNFKNLENIIIEYKKSNKIDNQNLKVCLNNLIADIEKEEKDEFKNCSYIEDEIRKIVFK